MIPKRSTSDTLIKLAIGAIVLTLGLMAFSSLCWLACRKCSKDNILSSFGFWELVGVGAISFFGVVIWRSMRKRRESALGDEYPMAGEVDPVPPPPPQPERTGNWRTLYAQLSHDEREKLKAMMEKYCADGEAASSTQVQAQTNEGQMPSH
jgi:hypothetical protein